MDELKKYLHDQRDKLDVEPAPSTAVWEQIQQQSTPGRKPVFSLTARWVAAASIIIVAGLAIILLKYNKPANPGVAVTKTGQSNTPPAEVPKKVDTATEE